MYGNSRPVSSVQQGPHERLEALVRRHAAHPYRRPIAPYSRDALDAALAHWDGRAPLLLDAGCGVGLSTLELARRHPDHFVLGVDRSADRLARGKGEAAPAWVHFVRADLEDVWLLLAQRGLRLARHYLLYPNPSPKPAQVQRRWPAHPVFPTVLALGGVLECRSNWAIYMQEFALAVGWLCARQVTIERVSGNPALSAFERKYRDSGHSLWRVVVDLDAPA